MIKNKWLTSWKEFYQQYGFARIFWTFLKVFIPLFVMVQVYLIFLTPHLFNTFNYNTGAGQKTFAALVTDSAEIKEQLKPKNEKLYSGVLKKRPYSICYAHGFSASRMELEPVISNVAKQLNANLFFTRLSGHGYKDTMALKHVKAQDWIKDVIECVEVAARTGDKVVLIGMSTGAALSSLVAAHTPYKISSLILISPYFGVKDRKSDYLAGFYGDLIANHYFKGFRSFEPVNNQEEFWSTRYPAAVLKPLMIVSQAVRAMDFSLLKMPVFFAYSKQDEVIDLAQMHLKYDQIKTYKRLDSDTRYTSHVLAGDVVNPQANAQLQKNLYSFIKAND